MADGDLLADRYRLGSSVGHGAMGEVHLAEDIKLARPVAIKSLRPELARHPEVRRRFGHEAKAAARISHPNVVRVYDSGEHNHIPYLVMECLPGTSLVDELARGTLEPRRVRRVGLDVLGALDAAHRLGVVHRDVKPGNILLSAAVEGPVKVSDFGIAKIGDDQSVNDSGALAGTPGYLAPERVAGEPAGPGSDLYSLGVVLYESLAGRRPYEAETSLALALAIHMGPGADLLELRPDLDPALVAIIDKALARDLSERWDSATSMAEALRAWRPRGAGRGLAASTAGAGSAAAGLVGSNTGPLSPVAIPAGAGTAAAAAAGFRLDDGSASRQRRRTGILCVGAAGLLLVVLIGMAALRSPGRAEPGSPPTSIGPLAEAPTTTSPPETSVPAPPPSSATLTKRTTTTRATQQVRTEATTAPSRPATTVTTVHVTTTKPPSPTTIPTTTIPTTTPTTAAP